MPYIGHSGQDEPHEDWAASGTPLERGCSGNGASGPKRDDMLMWILITWVVIGLFVAILFGSICRRSEEAEERVIRTRAPAGRRKPSTAD